MDAFICRYGSDQKAPPNRITEKAKLIAISLRSSASEIVWFFLVVLRVDSFSVFSLQCCFLYFPRIAIVSSWEHGGQSMWPMQIWQATGRLSQAYRYSRLEWHLQLLPAEIYSPKCLEPSLFPKPFSRRLNPSLDLSCSGFWKNLSFNGIFLTFILPVTVFQNSFLWRMASWA